MNFKKFHESRNLFDKTSEYVVGTLTYNYTISGLNPNKYYTCSTNFEKTVTTASIYFGGGSSDNNGVWSNTPRTFKPDANGKIIVYIRFATSAGAPAIYDDLIAGTIWVMVNEGSTPQPYEPYSSEVWHEIPYYQHKTATDTLTLPAVIYPNDTSITVGLKGNEEDTGTPSPQNPVVIDGTGDRTGNLWDEEYPNISGTIRYIPLYVGEGSFTLSTTTPYDNGVANIFLLSGNVSSGASTPGNGAWKNHNVTAQSVDGYVTIAYRHYSSTTSPVDCQTMLNTGSTPLSYEPYGYKIPISSANTTTPVYLGEVETTRKIKKLVLTGSEDENWNTTTIGTNDYIYRMELSDLPKSGVAPICTHYTGSTASRWVDIANYEVTTSILNSVAIRHSGLTGVSDWKTYLQQQYAAGTPVTVWYVLATEQTAVVNEPLMKIGDYADTVSGITIPTIAGANTISVDTQVQPSEVTVNYKGWHPVADVHEADNGAWT